MYANFYPRPPQGGRHCKFFRPRRRLSYFYPRPPQGGRLALPLHRKGVRIFLSTPSARRATGRRSAATGHPPDFYPRPPQGGRRFSGLCLDLRIDISIHALRKEGDRQRRTAYESESISIHALRKEGDGVTIDGAAEIQSISIHALRKEGDSKNGEKHLRFCFIIKRSAQIWKSLSKNIRKNSCDLHKTA